MTTLSRAERRQAQPEKLLVYRPTTPACARWNLNANLCVKKNFVKDSISSTWPGRLRTLLAVDFTVAHYLQKYQFDIETPNRLEHLKNGHRRKVSLRDCRRRQPRARRCGAWAAQQLDRSRRLLCLRFASGTRCADAILVSVPSEYGYEL